MTKNQVIFEIDKLYDTYESKELKKQVAEYEREYNLLPSYEEEKKAARRNIIQSQLSMELLLEFVEELKGWIIGIDENPKEIKK